MTSTDLRLARVLLLLARFGKEGAPEDRISKVSEEKLAGIAGTTQLRVRHLMKRLRNAGCLSYRGRRMQIHRLLLNLVLNE